MKGDAQWDGDWAGFTAEFDIDVDSSNSLVSYLENCGNAVETLLLGYNFPFNSLMNGEINLHI